MSSEGSQEGMGVGEAQGHGLWKVSLGCPVFWLQSCPLTSALLPPPHASLHPGFLQTLAMPRPASWVSPEGHSHRPPALLLLWQVQQLTVSVGWPLPDPFTVRDGASQGITDLPRVTQT